MTLGMRDTAGRRGAPGLTDSGGRTQAQQQQQRRALTVRRAARHKRPRLEDPPPLLLQLNQHCLQTPLLLAL